MASTTSKAKKKTAKVRSLPHLLPKSYFSKRWMDFGAIVLLAFFCYMPILQNEFVSFDDPALITENPVVVDGDWSAVFSWGKFSPYYKPLVFLSWKLEKTLFGFNPFYFHLDNLLLHIFNCLILYLIVGRLTTFWAYTKKHRFAITFWTTVFFAIHPMHVESIAWAVERKDVLFSAFFLIGFYSYIKFLDSRHWKWIALTSVVYLCSMLCKAPGITLIAVLFCYDFLSKRSFNLQLFIEKIPIALICLLALYYYGIFNNFNHYTHGVTGGITSDGGTAGIDSIAESSSILSRVLWVNFKMLFWFFHSIIPMKLSIAYPRADFLVIAEKLSFILPFVTLAIAYFLYRSLASNRLIAFCAAFFLATLAPALILNDYGIGIFLSDRYTYLPSIGIAMTLAIGLHYIGTHWMNEIKQFTMMASIVVAGCLGISCFNQSNVWKNSESLWTNTIQKYPTVAYAYTNRSKYYLDRGQNQKALADLNQALRLNPKDDAALIERARTNRQMNKTDLALQDLNLAIQYNPKNVTAYLNRGNVYFDKRQINKALVDFDFVLQKEPNHLSALTNRSAIYAQTGKSDLAIQDLQKVLTEDPQHKDAYNNLIFAHFDRGEFAKALQNCNQYLKLAPNDHIIYHVRGVTQQSLGNQQASIQDFNKAIQLQANIPNYYESRAKAYRATGQEALAQADEQRLVQFQ